MARCVTLLLVLLALLCSPPSARAQEAAPGGPRAATAAGVAAPEERDRLRSHILDTARLYAEFEWRGDARNVLHGPDADGTHVDTPDVSFDERGWPVDGGAAHGMPYAWGGFTSIEEFRAGIAQGLPAGHVPTTERAQPSSFALGLDCSGYVARCWDLPVKQSTRSLGALCYPLAGYDALQPGDILNLFDSHVVIFERWVDDSHERMSVYEAARLGIARSVYTAEKLKAAGFEPMRYKPLDERWVPMDVGPPEFSAMAAERATAGDAAPGTESAAPRAESDVPRGRWTADKGGGAPLQLATLPGPLRDARPREWARHAVTREDLPGAPGFRLLSMVATAEDAQVEIQAEMALRDGTLSTGTHVEHADTFLGALLDVAASDEALTAITVGACTLTPGRYELAGRTFPAVRIEARLDASKVMRHQDYPVTLMIDAVISLEVPVHGVLHAQVTEETVWRAAPPEERSVSRNVSRYELLEFGGAP